MAESNYKVFAQCEFSIKKQSFKGIENIDRYNLNKLKKLIDRYIIRIKPIAVWDGELDDNFCTTDASYLTWREEHEDIFSKNFTNTLKTALGNGNNICIHFGNENYGLDDVMYPNVEYICSNYLKGICKRFDVYSTGYICCKIEVDFLDSEGDILNGCCVKYIYD